jgi:hypothetical protein
MCNCSGLEGIIIQIQCAHYVCLHANARLLQYFERIYLRTCVLCILINRADALLLLTRFTRAVLVLHRLSWLQALCFTSAEQKLAKRCDWRACTRDTWLRT